MCIRDSFKDEVRKAGLELGIPERLVFRQPFPGPGLGIRIIGEVTAEKVRMGTVIGGKRGLKLHANFSTYYALEKEGTAQIGKMCIRDRYTTDG